MNPSNNAKGSSVQLVLLILLSLAILVAIFITVKFFWPKSPQQALTPTATTQATNAKNQIVSLEVTGFPAKIQKDEKLSLLMKLKNISSAPFSFADIKNNKYGFELWQKDKTDNNEWMLEAQGYSYFRGLPDVRKLEMQDFGVINPGETKEVTFTLRELNTFDTDPLSSWTVLGKDQSGTFYSQYNGSKMFSCGTDIFRIEFGEVKNLHSNPRGLMIADLFKDAVISNEFKMDTGALHQCSYSSP